MVSIIIPIYNSQRFLRQCIDSCLRQSYADLEIILVNDASTDDSLKICESYCSRDSRIRVINNTQNEGVEKARYRGLSLAKGKYVMFLDSDDWLCDRNIIQKLVFQAENKNVDYVEFQFQRVVDRWGLIRQVKNNRHEGLITQPELFDKYYLSFFGKNLLSTHMCGKLYLKSTLDKTSLEPLGLKMCEDHAFNLRLFPHLSLVYIMKDIGYSYRWGGMTSKYNPYFYLHCKALYLYREELLKQYNYIQAIDPLRIEMKNVFITQIAMLITYNIKSEQDIMQWIHDELEDPMWKHVYDLTHPETLHSIGKREMEYIKSHNIIALYQLGKKQSNSGKPMRLLKRFLFYIANLL